MRGIAGEVGVSTGRAVFSVPALVWLLDPLPRVDLRGQSHGGGRVTRSEVRRGRRASPSNCLSISSSPAISPSPLLTLPLRLGERFPMYLTPDTLRSLE